jgi:6-phosphogluconolactonase (cycloisomerase 2 family)
MTHTFWKTVGATLTALTLLAGLTACGGGGGGDTASTATSTSDTVSASLVDASTGQWHPNGYAITGRRPSSVSVEPSGQFAYVTNFYANSVSAYQINASTGALTKVGDDVPSGETPHAITFDAQHRYAYVTNRGGISIYAIDATSGALSKVGDDVTTGPGSISLLISPSGQSAYAATADDGAILAFAINAQTGALTPIGDAIHVVQANLTAMDPGGKFIYVHQNNGVVASYGINAITSALSKVGDDSGRADDNNEPVAITVAPSGKFGYVANKSGNTIWAYAVDPTTGAWTYVGEAASGQQPVGITVDASGRFAYAANGGDNTVTAYNIDPITGKLTSFAQMRTQGEPGKVALVSGQTALSVTPQFVYAASAYGKQLSSYTIDAKTGALSKLSDMATENDVNTLATAPDGRFAYVAQSSSNVITVYAIDSTGALRKLGEVGASDSSLPAPSAIVAEPSGRFVYASFRNTKQIQVYTVDRSTGNLLAGELFDAGIDAYQLLVDPLGQSLYANSWDTYVLTTWHINPADGSLSKVFSLANAENAAPFMAMDPSGKHIYVAAHGHLAGVKVFDIDAMTGGLGAQAYARSPAVPEEINQQMQSLAIDASGRFAHAAIHDSEGVYTVLRTYAIGATGALSQVDEVPFGSVDSYQGPVATDPSGQFVYAFEDTMTTTWRINASTGVLSKVGELATGGGTGTSAFVVAVTGVLH